MSEKQETKLVEVTLAKRHTHAGVEYAAGTKIKVDEPTAKWLADNKVIANAPLPDIEQLDHPWIREYFHGPRARAARGLQHEHA